MAKTKRTGARLNIEPIILTSEANKLKLPQITFHAGRPLDGGADLVVIPVLQRMSIHSSLRPKDAAASQAFQRSIAEQGFKGKYGHTLTIDLPQADRVNRKAVLIGLGSPKNYCGKVACHIFETAIDQAIREGVTTLSIPFVSNPGTGGSLPHRSTAVALQNVLRRVYAGLNEQPTLESIHIYCTPQAKHHIREGLLMDMQDVSDQPCLCLQPQESKPAAAQK